MSKIKLEVGMQVYSMLYENGLIENLNTAHFYPITVKFKDKSITFRPDGKEVSIDANPTLKLLNIPFTEGLEVECDIYGKGVVIEVAQGLHESNKIIIVLFDNGVNERYSSDGRINQYANQTLHPQFTI